MGQSGGKRPDLRPVRHRMVGKNAGQMGVNRDTVDENSV